MPVVVMAARVAKTFQMDPVTVLDDRSSLWPAADVRLRTYIRLAAAKVVADDEEKQAKQNKAGGGGRRPRRR